MLVATGFFDQARNPCVKIRLSGAFSGEDAPAFDAIVDTGFTGFVAMPLIRAFPLGLPLLGTTTVTLADGQSHTKLLAQTFATVGERSNYGLVILEPSSTEVLVGMDFLRTFGVALFVSERRIALYDEAKLQKIMADEAP